MVMDSAKTILCIAAKSGNIALVHSLLDMLPSPSVRPNAVYLQAANLNAKTGRTTHNSHSFLDRLLVGRPVQMRAQLKRP